MADNRDDNERIAYYITDERLDELIAKSATSAVKEFTKNHPCRFTDEEASMVHKQHEAHSEEGADAGTWRIIIQMGKSYQDVTRSMRRFGVAVILFISLLGFLFVHFMKK
jgi:hypothetical protein